MTSTMLQHLHLYLRERRLLQACLLQCRTGHWSSAKDQEQGKEDSRRAKRQSRRTQRSVLRQWKGAFELEDWEVGLMRRYLGVGLPPCAFVNSTL